MKIALGTVIPNLKGEPFKEGDEDLTLRSVCGAALASQLPNDEQLSGAKKAAIGALAVSLYARKTGSSEMIDEVDLGVDDAKTIMDRVGKMWNPLVTARAFALLDPKPVAAAAE